MNENSRNDCSCIPNYPKVLKIVEEICNFYILVSLLIVGLESKTFHFFMVVILLAFIITAILLANTYFDLIEINTPYLWIEFGYGLTSGVLIAITTTILLANSDMKRAYILVYVTGFSNAILYFVDALDKYRSAINSRRKLYWNRPLQMLYEEE